MNTLLKFYLLDVFLKILKIKSLCGLTSLLLKINKSSDKLIIFIFLKIEKNFYKGKN